MLIDGYFPQTKTLKCAPQGSTLGPLLFLIRKR